MNLKRWTAVGLVLILISLALLNFKYEGRGEHMLAAAPAALGSIILFLVGLERNRCERAAQRLLDAAIARDLEEGQPSEGGNPRLPTLAEIEADVDAGQTGAPDGYWNLRKRRFNKGGAAAA